MIQVCRRVVQSLLASSTCMETGKSALMKLDIYANLLQVAETMCAKRVDKTIDLQAYRQTCDHEAIRAHPDMMTTEG